MEKRLDRLETKMDVMATDMAEVKTDLREHMRRSLANEESNKLLREYIDAVKESMDKKVEPLATWQDRIKFLGWCIGVVTAGIVTAEKLGLFRLLF